MKLPIICFIIGQPNPKQVAFSEEIPNFQFQNLNLYNPESPTRKCSAVCGKIPDKYQKLVDDEESTVKEYKLPDVFFGAEEDDGIVDDRLDPETLTVPQLKELFINNEVEFPEGAKKQDLVKLAREKFECVEA